MSDGTLRFLGYLAALMTLPEGGVLVTEELETGLHPARDGVDAVRDEGPAGGVLARIKSALDPAGIVSPGRYV